MLYETDSDKTQMSLKADNLKEITALLKNLEESKVELDIVSLGISSPTMEEVFMMYLYTSFVKS